MASVLVKLVTLVAMVMVSESGPTFPWVNEYDGQMDFKCPDKQIIMYLSSIHDDQREDRIWEMLCRTAEFGDYCVQSDYVNNFDQTFNYTCPGNKVLTGISSYHYDSYEDRRFRFTCCRASKRWLSECYTTDFVNEWDLKLTLFVPEGQAIKSIYSINDDTRSDRRFKFVLCNL
ncbi:dermatopontin [Biomphalaria glabrata]|uniref:Dermatopontin-like n=1 Tax=Biomphalaria glabrata TaxID=6526 RepID=A0A9W3BES4_BIOGL|nr:dermatopontin-like [Biomphalaria glabrata]XP_055897946.1 dermatopontin-like [Biomphalaria glabrata]KAI8729942.1 dermatopontin-like dermatopontin-like Cell adhesion/Resistant factor [Biomphalaria glabrata]KAI8750476.1 dermatopontin [Biomphalaria glabrata]